ncbi:MAG TPA: hypothetical protein VFE60_21120 [Roseiarcus sp.]|jgi:hypothetical protein|nr:hypothetical protein [Roseiarcus sp.]
MERYEFTPMLGPAEHFPVGSVEWSQRISNRLQIFTNTVSYDVEHGVARCHSIRPSGAFKSFGFSEKNPGIVSGAR